MALLTKPGHEGHGGKPLEEVTPSFGQGVHGPDPGGPDELPPADKARTIGELLAEAKQKSGAAKLAGHDIMALERFDPDTRHMIVFDVLSHESPVGWKGEKMRLFLTEAGYGKALENQDKGFIRIRNHAKVLAGNLRYDRKDREL